MKRFRKLGLLSLSLWLLPAVASAYSFLPGGFLPGEKILSIELSAAEATGVDFTTGADPFDFTDDELVFESSVSTITTDQRIIGGIPLGDVLVQSTLSIVAGPFSPLFIPGPPLDSVGAFLANGLVADVTITDMGVGGAGLLLAGEYFTAVEFQANELAGAITASLAGDFDVTLGLADFTSRFGSAGNFFSVLAGLKASGVEITDLCGQITNADCLLPPDLGGDFTDWTASPTTTIVPLVPEPHTLSLLGIALLGVAALRRR